MMPCTFPITIFHCHALQIRKSVLAKRKCLRQLGYIFFSSSKHKEKEMKKEWKSVVGLEVHAQINSASKLFSGAGTEFAAPVNTNVSLFDAAIPGTLPVLNRRCIEAGVLTALALSCTINPVSLFDRKHYFYADLPAGYQITQQRLPLAHSGELQFHVSSPHLQRNPYDKKARIKQLQLEQDSGKSLHDEEASRSLVDLNRAGIPLMEIVFEPDLENGEEAAALVKELMIILERLGTCSCKMEEGALRVDANVSVHKPYEPLGVRTEVKNISSVRGLANAIQYEIKRQIETLEDGGVIVNETRAWDDESGETISMRDKEEKQDYRYMPEPNLPPLRLIVDPNDTIQRSNKNIININDLRKKLPELPAETRERLVCKFGLKPEIAAILVNENLLLEHFNCIVQNKKIDPKRTANILINEYITVLNKNKISLESSSVSSQSLGEIVELLQSGKVNQVTARRLLQESVSGNPHPPSKLVDILGLHQITDKSEIEKLCVQILDRNPKEVEQYIDGKTNVFKFFLGLIAKETNYRANMTVATEMLKNNLNKLRSHRQEAVKSK